MSNSANTKRIAKNTLLLYSRMFFSMAISLYTSRVVLQTLGVEDFGIYNVVGGVVVLFSFINASMGTATSRFLTFEIGKGEAENMRTIFSTAFYIHLVIAFILLILAETIGLWFLNNKLVIPESQLRAAQIVYQCSVISTIVSITQVPYNAMIIAYERMNVYAYVEILNVLLKLIIVLLLPVLPFDKLITYGILILGVSLIIALVYRSYCYLKFAGSHLQWQIDKSIVKEMSTFFGWDLYGNMSVTARTQGVNMLLNIFFGAVLNASAGIATQVQGAVMMFSSNILTAFRPQIVKSYAEGNYQYMHSLISNGVKVSYILLLVISLPIINNIEYILYIWLGQVPEYAPQLCIWTLIFNLFAAMSSVVVSGIHATGKVIRPSIINGTLYLCVVPLTYIAFRFYSNPIVPFILNVASVFIGLMSNIYTLSLYIPSTFNFKRLIVHTLAPMSTLTVLVVFVMSLFSLIQLESIVQLILDSIVSTLSVFLLTYFLILDTEQKNQLKTKIFSRYGRKTC